MRSVPRFFFRKNRIHNCRRCELVDMFPFSICEKRNFSLFPASFALCKNIVFCNVLAHNTFHCRSSIIYSLAESHVAANGAWAVAFQNQNMVSALMKFMNHSRCQITAAPHQNHFILSKFHSHIPAVHFLAFLLPKYHKALHKLHPGTEIHRTVPQVRM